MAEIIKQPHDCSPGFDLIVKTKVDNQDLSIATRIDRFTLEQDRLMGDDFLRDQREMITRKLGRAFEDKIRKELEMAAFGWANNNAFWRNNAFITTTTGTNSTMHTTPTFDTWSSTSGATNTATYTAQDALSYDTFKFLTEREMKAEGEKVFDDKYKRAIEEIYQLPEIVANEGRFVVITKRADDPTKVDTKVTEFKEPIKFVSAGEKRDIEEDGGDQYYPIGRTMFESIFRYIGELNLPKNWKGFINLPNGAVIHVIAGSILATDDSNSKVVYKANHEREFNRYLNASDLIEDFIKFLSDQGVPPDLLLKIPVEVFINFLVVKAAEADGEDVPRVPIEDHPEVTQLQAQPKLLPRPSDVAPPEIAKPKPAHCKLCGRFIAKTNVNQHIYFCDEHHGLIYFTRRTGNG